MASTAPLERRITQNDSDERGLNKAFGKTCHSN